MANWGSIFISSETLFVKVVSVVAQGLILLIHKYRIV